jgi:hypothetical protein
MAAPSAVARASFVSWRLLTICTSKTALVIDLQPPHLLSHIEHGPFLPATLFTVIATDTAPFLPTFLLVYGLDSGALVRSTECASDILGLQLCDRLLYVSLESAIAVLTAETLQGLGSIERRSRRGVFEAAQTLLAFGDDDHPGFVQLCAVPGYAVVREIECHRDPIRCRRTARF